RLPQPHLRPDFTARFDLVIVHGHSYSALVLKKRAKKSQALSAAKNLVFPAASQRDSSARKRASE
ncbi:MAG: hypothetical protein NTY65_02370, partial [Planctomycetota bacterium]|nr:hypothetical protein [Planctomycetota bacterium]